MLIGTLTDRANVYYILQRSFSYPAEDDGQFRIVVWSADYKPFGKATVTVSTITNNLRFPGQYYDAETGLNKNYFPDYYPAIGRYIERDPFGIEGGLNLYNLLKRGACMYKIINLILFAFVTIVFAKVSQGQEVPVFKDIKVDSKVDVNKNTGLYTYLYKIINPKGNTGQIENLQIDIAKPQGGMSLSNSDLMIHNGTNRKGVMLKRSFDEERKFMDLPFDLLIPVGSQPPTNWSSGISRKYTVSWGVRSKKYQILPGQAAEGFLIISRGLPSIRNITVRPDWILTVEGYVSEEDIEESKRIEKEITFSGKTVGPTAPPADFKPVAFIEYIIDLKHQAVSLGWIKDEGIVNSLDVKLDNAKKKLEQDSPGAAKNILNALINEVEAQGCVTFENCPPGKHLTSEAYALLKYNAQYLIDNLK